MGVNNKGVHESGFFGSESGEDDDIRVLSVRRRLRQAPETAVSGALSSLSECENTVQRMPQLVLRNTRRVVTERIPIFPPDISRGKCHPCSQPASQHLS